jgi:hypothetical protein
MKTRHAVTAVAFGLTLAATLFAAEQRTAKALPNVIKLKAHGEVVSDMRFYKGFKLRFLDVQLAPGPKTWEHDPRPTRMTIEITPTGESPIIVTAEDIDLSGHE